MFSALDIKTLMQGTLYGDPSLRVDTIRPIHSPLVGGLSIVMTPGDLLHIPTTGADIIIGPEEIISSNAKAKIVVDYLNVNNLNKVLRYFKVHKYRLFEQENTSTIPDVYIGKHCQIGMNCHFMPGVKIMNCVTIGDNIAIHANTVIKEGTIIGNDVIIDSNNSIGNYSFEYMSDERDSYVRVDSIGRVIIGDDVEIGCNNTIDRGTLGDTIIGQGTRIDNQVQIGHDCIIGNKCLIVSQCGFSGHVVLGDHVITHGQVGIAGHISIGSYSVIKAKSGVSHSCPEKSDLFGYPAKNTREYNKNLAVLNKLTKQHGVYKQ
ncbi:UDP-3-O-(3-hydroxymyristoyl)glucosamine N-acyltransferase [Escherichia coli]|uniref:UDP-3-O-(3-hydroxymyristoyl)glucosamine N-acyltransferase n=1 Tax=Escherichia coli TaxID=562 RepID=UPI001CF27FAF|nr:UDP-3-O-(3-hydroxymyristoyl)glucosamine N-acyltransferase [Escherichia coli]MCA8567442.1 UDP-3-O-(3-hydroxymyristoyl)glucosamine N-acyltransferase [Escherichia coli]MCA8734364.1 UDP-3-O-(3-hydroxymyristoyl)glucosamine N-acyltransferase [Escherichia coli]